MKAKTLPEIRQEFDENGVNISEWARTHGFEYHIVADVINGRSKGKRGEAHRCAVLLGLKVGKAAKTSKQTTAKKPSKSLGRRKTKRRVASRDAVDESAEQRY